ncbi:MAG TPA: sigma-70 family RNA polymerase sigma factor [Pyrinomonadaceae bacterium]|nr:sigma-70 family RNA polymerase sigma factor [Pyrinomonadaceae bacterium]
MTTETERCEMSDYTLAQRAGTGDMQAVEQLYLRHNRNVYSICLRMTTNVADSEDLAQEVFIQVLRYVRGVRGDSAFKAWLSRLTVNHVLMHFRRRSSRPEQLSDEEISDRALGDTEPFRAMTILNRIALQRAIAQLPPGYRDSLISFMFAAMTTMKSPSC